MTDRLPLMHTPAKNVPSRNKFINTILDFIYNSFNTVYTPIPNLIPVMLVSSSSFNELP